MIVIYRCNCKIVVISAVRYFQVGDSCYVTMTRFRMGSRPWLGIARRQLEARCGQDVALPSAQRWRKATQKLHNPQRLDDNIIMVITVVVRIVINNKDSDKNRRGYNRSMVNFA